MKTIRLGLLFVAVIAAGCSSHPPRDYPPQATTVPADPDSTQRGESFVALPETQTEAPDQAAEQQGEDPAARSVVTEASPGQSSRQQYGARVAVPEAETRALQFYLNTQTFDYIEDGEVFVSGPIASGKARSPTPTGNFSVLSKNKDKESSRYDNEIGTPAWMPFSMQFYGNYFVHEGYLPGQPASHGCIRMGHYDARLLFERMKVGDPVVVSK